VCATVLPHVLSDPTLLSKSNLFARSLLYVSNSSRQACSDVISREGFILKRFRFFSLFGSVFFKSALYPGNISVDYVSFLRRADPPIIDNMPKELEAALGSNVVLQCMVQAYPEPRVKWFVDGKSLNRSARHFFAARDQLLVIVAAGSHDQGVYECEAKNELGKKRGETKLVLRPGEWSRDFAVVRALKRVACRAVWGSLSVVEVGGRECFWGWIALKSLNVAFRLHLASELNGGDGAWAINGPKGKIIIAVFACVIVTSLAWLAVLCYTRKNPEGAFSTNTGKPPMQWRCVRQ